MARVIAAEPVGETHITNSTVDIGESAPITVACGANKIRAKQWDAGQRNGLDLSRDHAGIIEWEEPGSFEVISVALPKLSINTAVCFNLNSIRVRIQPQSTRRDR